MSNTIEYLLRLRDEFSGQMKAAQSTGTSGFSGLAAGAAGLGVALFKMRGNIGAIKDAFTGDFSHIGDVLQGIPGPIGEIGQAALNAAGQTVQATIDMTEGYRKLATQTGSTVEFLSQFTEAADDMRIKSEDVATGFEKLAKGMGGIEDATDGAMAGGKGVAGVLADLGIAAHDSEGKLRDIADVVPEIADAFAKMADGPAKTAMAIQLFGKKGGELIPILDKGSASIKGMMQNAEELGLTITGKTVKAVDELKKAQDDLGDSFEGIKRSLGVAVLPELARYFGLLASFNEAHGKTTNIIEKSTLTFKYWGAALTGGTAETIKQEDALRELGGLLDDYLAKGTLTKESQDAITSSGGLLEEQIVALSKKFDENGGSVESATHNHEALAHALMMNYPELFKVGEAGKVAAIGMDAVSVAAQKQMEANPGYIKALLEMRTAQENSGKASGGFTKSFEDNAAAIDKARGALDLMTGAIDPNIKAMDKMAQAKLLIDLVTGKTTTSQVEGNLTIQALSKSLQKGTIDLDTFYKIYAGVASKTIDFKDAMIAAGMSTDKQTVAAIKSVRAVEMVAEANGVNVKSQLAYADALKIVTQFRVTANTTEAEYATFVNANAQLTEVAKDQQAALNEQHKAGKLDAYEYQKGMSEVNGALADQKRLTDNAAAAYNNGNPIIASTTAVMGDLKGAMQYTNGELDLGKTFADNLSKSLGLIPPKTEAEVATPGVEQAIGAVDNLFSSLAAIPDDVTTNIKTEGVETATSAAKKFFDQIMSIPTTWTTRINTITTSSFVGPVNPNPIGPPSPPKCFIAGTLIHTPSGPKAIETFAIGDTVIAFDHESGMRAASRVVQTFVSEAPKTLTLKFANNTTLRCTSEHPFWSHTRHDYIAASELSPGEDVLICMDGGTTQLETRTEDEPAIVYNIEVARYNNYFAGDILVHNASEYISAMQLAMLSPNANVHVNAAGRYGSGAQASAGSGGGGKYQVIFTTPPTSPIDYDMLAQRLQDKFDYAGRGM